MSKNNYILYDIETKDQVNVQLDKYNNPFKAKISNDCVVTSIAMINVTTGKEKVYTIGLNGIESEMELLAEIKPFFDNKDNILIAWNGNGFDDPIMIKKLGLQENECCKFFDLKKGYSKFVINKKDDYLSLSDVAMQVGSFKDDVNPVEAYNNGDLELLAKYNLQDVRAMLDIDNKYNIINTAQEFKDIVGLNDYNRLFTVTKPLESFINKEGFKLGSNNSKSFFNFGGLNYFKNTGLQSNLKHFDVKSFYPFMMLALEGSSNLDYREIQQDYIKEIPDDLIELENDKESKFYISEDGLTQCKWNQHRKEYVRLQLTGKFNVTNGNGDIKRIIEPLFTFKDTATDNYKRQAYKTLINGFYGALDSKYFNYQHRRLSATTTFLCRYVLWNCINHFDGVYAKTDSIWTTNTNLTEAELNDFSNKLLTNIGLPAPNIQWELESIVDKLIIKDKNNYIEVINGETHFKGSFPYPVQQLVLESAINNPVTIDVNNYLDKYINNVPLFCEHTKLSSKQKTHLKNNTSLSELKQYKYLWDWKNYIYCSDFGYVHSDTVDKFTLPVNKDFAKAIINNILVNWDLLPSDKRLNFNKYWKKQMNKPKYVPMYLGKDNRFVQDNKAIAKILGLKGKFTYDNSKANSIILANKPEFDYNGLVLGANYFAVDIDRKDFGDRTDKVKDTIVALFNKNQYVLQSTKSNGYHIIFKTSNKNIFKIPTNSNNPDYKGLELKVKAILPYNNTINDELKYEVIYGNINKLKNFNQIGKLAEFYGEMKTQTKLDTFIEADNTDYNVSCDYFDDLKTVILDIAKDMNGNSHNFCIALGTALKGNVSYEEANTIFQEVIAIIGSDKNKLGTLKQFFNNADGNNKSYGRLITYMKHNGLKQHIRMLDTITGNTKTTPIKAEIINNSETKANNKVYAEVEGSVIRNGQIKWVKITKDDEEELITMFNGVFYNLEVKEDVNNLVKPIYTLNVKRKGANDLTFTGSLKEIKESLFTYSLVFTGDKDQNIMKYLQRAFTSDNETCKHIKENLTGGYVNTAMLPDKAPSKDEFMKGWELFIEIWEALPEIHKKCFLAMVVGNFKYIIISNAIGDSRLIAKAVFLYGTSNSMKTTLVELVKGMFKMTENVLPLGSEVNSPDRPVSLANALASTCGLVLVDDNDTIFEYPNTVDFEKVIKSTENMNLPARTDMTKGVGNNQEFKNLGCPVITSNKPKISILDKQSILKRSYVFNFTEEFNLSQKLGRNIKPSEVNKLQAIGKAIAYALKDIDWENLPYNYAVNDLVNHIFGTIAKIYDVDVTPVTNIEVSNEFNPSTIGERVNVKFMNKYKTNWKNYIDELDDPTELPFIFENRKGYWVQASALYDYVRDLLNDGGMSKSAILKELGLDEIKSVVKRVGDSSKRVLDKQYSKGDLGKLFS